MCVISNDDDNKVFSIGFRTPPEDETGVPHIIEHTTLCGSDRPGHDARYAIDSTKLQQELGWEPSLQFEEGIEKTVRWYLDHQEWLDNITSGEYEKYYQSMYAGR